MRFSVILFAYLRFLCSQNFLFQFLTTKSQIDLSEILLFASDVIEEAFSDESDISETDVADVFVTSEELVEES